MLIEWLKVMFTERAGKVEKELAHAIVEACDKPSKFKMLYSDKLSLIDKIYKICTEVYSAGGVEYSEHAKNQLDFYQKNYGHLPVCMAKTQYSLSHDPNCKGWPKDFMIPVREVFLSAGAGFIYVLTGAISTMPGLGTNPSYTKVDIDAKGNIVGLF